MTKYTGLSALIALIFCENGFDKRLTGYDLTKMISARGLSFSHQQVYREAPRLFNDILDIEIVPQDGKPDRKEFYIVNGVSIESVVESIEFSKSFPTEYALAFNNIALVNKAIDSAKVDLVALEKDAQALRNSTSPFSASQAYTEAKVSSRRHWLSMLENHSFKLESTRVSEVA